MASRGGFGLSPACGYLPALFQKKLSKEMKEPAFWAGFLMLLVG